MEFRRVSVAAVSLIALGLVLSACSTSTSDWGDKLQDTLNDMNLFGTAKKPLPGERKEIFPGGAVPGVTQGVPPALMPGGQEANAVPEPPPAEPAPPPAVKKKVVKKKKRPPAQASNPNPPAAGVWPAPPNANPPPPPPPPPADGVWPPPPR